MDEEGRKEGMKTGKKEGQIREPRVVDLYWRVRQVNYGCRRFIKLRGTRRVRG